ncbi:MAG: hypothetical protein HYU36_08335 [Planctomycetes bacterium]|nr:hypothetical protein [Planctomycetota bacterium]
MSKKKTKGGKAAASGKGAGAKAAKAEAAEAKEPKAPKAVEPKVSQAELDALRKPVEAAKGGLENAQAEAKALAEKANAGVAEAKDAYRTALAPYREACQKAGVECEYEGGRSANVSGKVSFLVEKTDPPARACPARTRAGKGVRVMVKGQPKTEDVIPLAALKESINKAAYGYTDKHVGPKEEVGNPPSPFGLRRAGKGGSLSNRLCAVLNA